MSRRSALHRRAAKGARDPESGAAAVEFALVLPVLLLILFGIVDYGLYFSTSIQLRSGLHDAARQYAVEPTTPCTPTGSWRPPPQTPTTIANLMCTVHNRAASATGTSYVRVDLPDGWVVDGAQQPGDPAPVVVVCERTDVTGVTGFVPLPGHGRLESVSVVAIEQDVTDVRWFNKLAQQQFYEDPTPDNDTWSWCTP
jgi:Flp pilus assembly protein TadG